MLLYAQVIILLESRCKFDVVCSSTRSNPLMIELMLAFRLGVVDGGNFYRQNLVLKQKASGGERFQMQGRRGKG